MAVIEPNRRMVRHRSIYAIPHRRGTAPGGRLGIMRARPAFLSMGAGSLELVHPALGRKPSADNSRMLQKGRTMMRFRLIAAIIGLSFALSFVTAGRTSADDHLFCAVNAGGLTTQSNPFTKTN